MIFNRLKESLSDIINTRPLAVFSALTFTFMVLRLYVSLGPLIVLFLLISISMIWLNFSEHINNFILVFICSSVILGIFSANLTLNSDESLINSFDGEYVRVRGFVSSVPQKSGNKASFYFTCEEIQGNKDYKENIKIFVRKCEDFDIKYGDILTFNASFNGVYNTKSGKHYLAKGAKFLADNVQIISIKEPVFPKNIIPLLRNGVSDIANEFFVGDARALFKALTIGDRSDFSDDLMKNLSTSGIIHITCVSGLHVSVLGMAVLNMLKGTKRITATLISLIIVWFFAAMTGFTPSVMRAAIMFTSFLSAKIAVRENDSITSLIFSAMVLGLGNVYVVYDWGFILSFLSVLGIYIFNPGLKKFFNYLPESLADSVSVTISAQLMTIPATINMFGYLSVHSIAANFVVSLTFIATLYLSLIFTFISFLPVINHFSALVCEFLLKLISITAKLFSDLPASLFYVEYFQWYEIVIYYLLLFMFAFRKKLSIYLIWAVMLFFSICLLMASFMPEENISDYWEEEFRVNFGTETFNKKSRI